jgi:(p)ppGpp synthase/HD superfamily hydrolase
MPIGIKKAGDWRLLQETQEGRHPLPHSVGADQQRILRKPAGTGTPRRQRAGRRDRRRTPKRNKIILRNNRLTMVGKAFIIASKAFEGVTDKAGKPYFYHLQRVANKQNSDKAKCVALLHDILEDCPDWNVHRLEFEGFSKDVIEAVELLTYKPDVPYPEYIDRIKANKLAVCVKLADLEDNMNLTRLPKLGDKDIERLKKYHAAYLQLKKMDQE